MNNLACFFVVRTAWAGGWSQSPQCLAWKVLSLERLEHTTSWEPQRQSAALVRALGTFTLTLKAISGIQKMGDFCVLFFFSSLIGLSLSSFVSAHHVSEVCGDAWNCHPTPLCLSIENVSENIRRDMSGVSVLSPAPEKSPLKERKGMPVFFVKTLILWLSGS